MSLFRDRAHAGERLASALEHLRVGRDVVVLALPRGGERRKPLELFAALDRPAQRAPARVVERAQHAGDVAQRRMLRAPLGQAARRLAFEVGDDEIVLLQQHLAEVDAALERVAAGTYGTCVRCGQPIGAARLEARPVSATCIGCALR